MGLEIKIDTVDLVSILKKKITGPFQIASKFAVEAASQPRVALLELEYQTLHPVKHPRKQAWYRGRPASRSNGATRNHIWQDIEMKADNYRNILGAWAVVGTETSMPHTHLIELGTGERGTKGEKGYTGVMPRFDAARTVEQNTHASAQNTLDTTFAVKYNSLVNEQ